MNFISGTKVEFPRLKNQGFVIPFFDSPTDDKTLGRKFHFNLINSANRTCWITTPYLILDSDMVSMLELAVQNGVDVAHCRSWYPRQENCV